jgi:GNAT superfamily N-acetyltransferase
VSETQPSIGFATADDILELARLRWELYAEQDGEPPEPFEGYADRFARFARSALASEEWRAWVARVEGRPAGAMWLQTIPRVPVPGRRAGPIGYLTNVYVVPEHRNVGIGARMLGVVTGWCEDQGYSEVIVWPTERSRAFYGRSGFERPDEPLVRRVRPDSSLEP